MYKQKNNWRNIIYYSQCWEDSSLLLSSLNLKSHENTLSILSGGENVFALALSCSKKIVAIDANLAQCYLMELKMLAIKNLNYSDFLFFLGYRSHNNRLIFFKKLEPFLSIESKNWWLTRKKLIKRGIAWQGKLEKYFYIFRNYILPLLIKKRNLILLLNEKNLKKRKEYWDLYTKESQWRFLLKLFSSRLVMSFLGRNPKMFKEVKKKNLGLHYYYKLRDMILNSPVDNYYLKAVLLSPGTYDELPFCYHKKNFKKLQNSLDKIEYLNYDLSSFLHYSIKNNLLFDSFNLSDIFEPLSKYDSDKLFSLLFKVAKSRAKLAYWCNLVPRNPVNSEWISFNSNSSLFDKVFFYSKFNFYIKNEKIS